MIKINNSQVDEIKKNGEQDFPNECCGIIFGKFESDKSKTVIELLSISNAREAENRYNRFLITPQEMMKAEVYAMKNKLDIIGFYHSHPDHPAIPSGYDLEHAWPIYSYIIVSVQSGKAADFTSWELNDNRESFRSEEIVEV